MKKIIITETQYKRLFTEEMVYNIDGDIDFKGNELSNGGPVSDQWTSILNDLDDLLDDSGIKYKITAGNDKFHKRANPKSRHAIGCAVDFALRINGVPINKNTFNINYASKVYEIMDELSDTYSSSHDFSWLDEYNKGKGHPTGGHIHMSIGRQYCGGIEGKEIKSTQKLPYNAIEIDDTLIAFGSKGDEVEAIQSVLYDEGYYLGTTGYNEDGIDGIFGQYTKDAVEEFQTDKKIQVDGIVGPETKKELGLA
jgi:hypothetical protein